MKRSLFASKYPKAQVARMGKLWAKLTHLLAKAHGLMQFKTRTSPAQFCTRFCSMPLDYSLEVFIQQSFEWLGKWYSSAFSSLVVVFQLLSRSLGCAQTEALSLHIACIRRPPANYLDFRGTDRFILVAKSFFSLICLTLSAKWSY